MEYTGMDDIPSTSYSWTACHFMKFLAAYTDYLFRRSSMN
jgi:hypothetical protein